MDASGLSCRSKIWICHKLFQRFRIRQLHGKAQVVLIFNIYALNKNPSAKGFYLWDCFIIEPLAKFFIVINFSSTKKIGRSGSSREYPT